MRIITNSGGGERCPATLVVSVGNKRQSDSADRRAWSSGDISCLEAVLSVE